MTDLFKPMLVTASCALLFTAFASNAEDQTILELMTIRVVPATDTLWGAEDPQTDAEWQALEDAAIETIKAFELAKAGGSGPNDDNWAANDDWQAFSDDVIAAAELAKLAIAERNIDALWDAGGPLYTPCEECHIAYNPGLAEQ
jgi:hypothetical protein